MRGKKNRMQSETRVLKSLCNKATSENGEMGKIIKIPKKKKKEKWSASKQPPSFHRIKFATSIKHDIIIYQGMQ